MTNDHLAVAYRFFHFSPNNAPSGYRGIQVLFEAHGTNPILITDSDHNAFVVCELWSNVTSLRTANGYWLHQNSGGTLLGIQCASYGDGETYRIKLTYSTYISMGGFLSLDGGVVFKRQEFVDQ